MLLNAMAIFPNCVGSLALGGNRPNSAVPLFLINRPPVVGRPLAPTRYCPELPMYNVPPASSPSAAVGTTWGFTHLVWMRPAELGLTPPPAPATTIAAAIAGRPTRRA